MGLVPVDSRFETNYCFVCKMKSHRPEGGDKHRRLPLAKNCKIVKQTVDTGVRALDDALWTR